MRRGDDAGASKSMFLGSYPRDLGQNRRGALPTRPKRGKERSGREGALGELRATVQALHADTPGSNLYHLGNF